MATIEQMNKAREFLGLTDNKFQAINFTFDMAVKLVDLKVLNLEDNQNESPTTDEFLHIARVARNEGSVVVFEGYITENDRTDRRVSIDGIRVRKPSKVIMGNLVNRRPNEFNYNEKTDVVRAWWD
jgi:hypothetical protein